VLAADRMADQPIVRWEEGGCAREARWRSERGAPPPQRVLVVDDRISADEAYGQACQGIALLWRGDFQSGRQLLAALAQRADRRRRRAERAVAPAGSAPRVRAFDLERQARAQRARTLGMLLVELGPDYDIDLRRAPAVRLACLEAFGPCPGPTVLSLRELQGVIGAHEWRRRGIEVPAAGGRVHPHYGVFAPIRNEYVGLVAEATLPAALTSVDLAFDVGTGTGVLAAVLARRGIGRVVATDVDARALACARENVARLGLADRVEVRQAYLFPDERAALVVCNPAWLPARPSSPLERAVYDPESRMLLGFLRGLAAHLVPGGEGWLILSDLAERLGLRSRSQLLAAFEAAGLLTMDRIDVRPAHPRRSDARDPLHAARMAEVTSLWRLRAAGQGVASSDIATIGLRRELTTP
jgi:SAM-dependent methyltransferase